MDDLETTLTLLERRRKAIEEMPLTEEEVQEALQEARRKKWHRQWAELYWKNQELIKPKE